MRAIFAFTTAALLACAAPAMAQSNSADPSPTGGAIIQPGANGKPDAGVSEGRASATDRNSTLRNGTAPNGNANGNNMTRSNGN